MSVDATRTEFVMVEARVQVAVGNGLSTVQNLKWNERDARDLMHALANALGYDAVPRT